VLRLSRLGAAEGAPPEDETPPDLQGDNDGD
jgi:hypothetical protein